MLLGWLRERGNGLFRSFHLIFPLWSPPRDRGSGSNQHAKKRGAMQQKSRAAQETPQTKRPNPQNKIPAGHKGVPGVKFVWSLVPVLFKSSSASKHTASGTPR